LEEPYPERRATWVYAQNIGLWGILSR